MPMLPSKVTLKAGDVSPEDIIAAKTVGYTYSSLINRILDLAHERYFGKPAPRDPVVLKPEEPDSFLAASQAPVQSMQAQTI